MKPRTVRFVASNRLEVLADCLAAELGDSTGDPLQGEVIVVQNRGMGTWLEQELARRNGITFHCEFPLPRRLLEQVAATVCPDARLHERFTPAVLTWRLHEELGRLDRQPLEGGAPLERYLGEDRSGFRRYQLATRLAEAFDGYLTYRGDWLTAWERGELALPGQADEPWQAQLWRRLLADSPDAIHLARLRPRLLERLRSDRPVGPGLPARLFVFGVSSIAPLYLEVFDALGRHLPVVFYRFEPCADYWGDILKARDAVRWLRRSGQGLDALDQLHPEPGHRLLASWGKPGQHLQRLALEFDWDPGDADRFQSPGRACLLHQLQQDILYLPGGAEDEAGGDTPAARPIDTHDRSLQVHSCHSPLRELQVLRDHLLDWFEHDRIRPSEILVMTPDIDTYAPLVSTVFGAAGPDGVAIPHSVADRSRRHVVPLAHTLLQLLELARGRLPAADVFGLLESEAVQRRFGLAPEDLDVIRMWLKEAPIWWGTDADARAELGFGQHPQGTWQVGAERLLLGYAIGDDPDPCRGVVAMPNVAGDRALCAGRLVRFLGLLRRAVAELREPRALSGWADRIQQLLDDFLDPPRSEADASAALREAVGSLRLAEQAGRLEEAVPLVAVLEHLRRTFERTQSATGFLAGGVTVCALQPMRSVPARVICVLGLNGDAFPRRPIPAEFDLMTQHPRTGDESRVDDDRYLFLETLLSARHALYLSYVGQSIRDNSDIPPSVLVSELLDTVAETWGDAVAERLQTRHRLHPFSPQYFLPAAKKADPHLFSYSQAHLEAARLLRGPRRAAPAFCPAPLAPPPDEARAVDLTELKSFLTHAARFFVERRLGFRLDRPEPELESREIFEPSALQKYGMRQDLLDWLLTGQDPGVLAVRWTSLGRLPLGPRGGLSFEHHAQEARSLADALRPRLAEPPPAPLEVQLVLGDFTLRGTLQRRGRDGILQCRPGKIRAKDRLTLWVDHLAYALAAQPDAASGLIGWDREKGVIEERYAAVGADAKRILLDLLELYWAGWQRPQPLIPEAAWQFVLQPEKGIHRARDRARSAWEGAEFGDAPPGEGEDPYWQLCLGRDTDEALGAEFESLARRVFDPLRATLEGSGELGKPTATAEAAAPKAPKRKARK